MWIKFELELRFNRCLLETGIEDEIFIDKRESKIKTLWDTFGGILFNKRNKGRSGTLITRTLRAIRRTISFQAFWEIFHTNLDTYNLFHINMEILEVDVTPGGTLLHRRSFRITSLPRDEIHSTRQVACIHEKKISVRATEWKRGEPDEKLIDEKWCFCQDSSTIRDVTLA